MKFLQKLGKALMLPVAVLPICGILMGIGYWLCPATMQGGDIQGAANLIGLFLVKAGAALIDHMAILFALGFRAGFSFSAGAMDLIFSSSLPAAQKTWLILPLGIAAFIVFYVVFLFAIKKFDLKTPGREDDDIEAEKKVELESNDYTAIAAKILEGCGGKENITSIDNCVTRLRLEVKDITAVNDKVIKSAGVAGVIKPGKTSVQVIIGTKVQFVADEFTKLCE